MRPQAVVHVDLDGATDIHRSRGWSYPYANDSLFESGMRNFLDLFDQEGIRATLFVIAASMEDPRKLEWLQEAVRRGHEIASHTISHAYLPQLDTKGKRREIEDSRSMLEDGLGVPVSGFRAPGYRIDRESIELLAECGYKYDASAFPTPKTAELMKTSVSNLRAIHRPMSESDFLSWPMPEYHPLPLPFNPSYSLLIGQWYFKWGVARFRQTGQPLTLLFHLVDAADPLAGNWLQDVRSRACTLSYLGTQYKLERCRRMLRHVRDNFVLTTTEEVLRGWRMRDRNR